MIRWPHLSTFEKPEDLHKSGISLVWSAAIFCPSARVSQVTVPGSHKCACFAVAGCHNVELPGPINLRADVMAYPGSPFPLDQHWREWLGLRADTIERANLVLLLTSPSATPEILDAETLEHERQLLAVLLCLFLRGVPSYSRALWLHGGRGEAEPHVRRVTEPPNYRKLAGTPPVTIDPAGLIEAGAMATELMRIDAAHRAARDYRRISRGFRTWAMGIERAYPEERLHQSVVLARVPGCIDVEAEALARTKQAEALARDVYRRLLVTPGLAEHWRTDAAEEAFWDLSETDRTTLWGPPLDLRTV